MQATDKSKITGTFKGDRYLSLLLSLLFALNLNAEETSTQFSSPTIITTPSETPPPLPSSHADIPTPNIVIPKEEKTESQIIKTSPTPEPKIFSTTPRRPTYHLRKKKNGLFVGLAFMNRPKLKWLSQKRLIIEGKPNNFFKKQRRFKKNIGASVEYSHFIHGFFIGAGADIWNESKAKDEKKVLTAPMAFYLSTGFCQPFQGDSGFLKISLGMGIGRTGHDHENVGVDIDESLGIMYQLGLGATFLHKFFLDVTFRRIYSSYKENGYVYKINSFRYRRKGKIMLEKPIIRLGIFI